MEAVVLGEMLKSIWNDFTWRGKLVLVAIPIGLYIFANTEFAPPNCDHERKQFALASNPNYAYRENAMHSWGRSLRECEARLVANQQQAARDKVNPFYVAQKNAASSAFANFWGLLIFLFIPIGCLLSYAHAAGRWGNAAYVKWTDF